MQRKPVRKNRTNLRQARQLNLRKLTRKNDQVFKTATKVAVFLFIAKELNILNFLAGETG